MPEFGGARTRYAGSVELDALEAILAPLDRARPFPACAYLDTAWLEAERRAMFDRAWHLVGREEEVAAPGAFVRTPLANGRVIVIRGEDLALRALFDVCLHRGATLTHGACGRASKLVCPYHGWTYDLSGALRAAPGAPHSLDRTARTLAEARVGTWKGFVFATLDRDAPPLDRALAPLPDFFERAQLATLKLGRRRSWEVAANWKLLVENFQESHHFARVHPGLEARTPARESHSLFTEGDGPWLGGVMPIEPGSETVSDDGRLHQRAFIVPAEARRRVHDALFLPATLFSLQPDYLLVYRLVPLAPTRTEITFDVLFHPTARADDASPAEVYAFWDRTNAEDRAICENQQRGIASGAWSPLCYATSEDGMHAFDRWVARALLRTRH